MSQALRVGAVCWGMGLQDSVIFPNYMEQAMKSEGTSDREMFEG